MAPPSHALYRILTLRTINTDTLCGKPGLGESTLTKIHITQPRSTCLYLGLLGGGPVKNTLYLVGKHLSAHKEQLKFHVCKKNGSGGSLPGKICLEIEISLFLMFPPGVGWLGEWFI